MPADAQTKPTSGVSVPLLRLPKAYFNCVEMLLNVLFSLVPIPFTAVMMAIEIPAATTPYSMAVAAESSATNARNFVNIDRSLISAR